VIGVAVRHLESGAERRYRGDESFPMASTYKVAIGACALRRVDAGELALDVPMPVEPRQRSTSSILSTYFPAPGLAVSLRNLLELMLTQSDNTATDVILEALGGGARVTACLREAGVTDMRVDRSTAQILRDYAGLATPADPELSSYDEFDARLARSEAEAWFLDGGAPHYVAFERDPRDQATPAAMTRLLALLWQDAWLSVDSGGCCARSSVAVRNPYGSAAACRTALPSRTRRARWPARRTTPESCRCPTAWDISS
jgi:beta-lactamase class A